MHTTLATVSLALLLATPLVAQDSTRRAPRPPSPSAETVLRLRQELELSEAQLRELHALRREALAARQARIAEVMEQRSRLLAGEITREELRAEMAKRREAGRDRVSARDDRVATVLTEGQRARLSELRLQALERQARMRRAPGARGTPRSGDRYGPGRRGPGGEPRLGPGIGPRWHRSPGDRMAPRMRRWEQPLGGLEMRPRVPRERRER